MALIAQNQITNPAVPSMFGGIAPNLAFANIIATIWRTAVILGGLALLVMLVSGALEWILAGGDKGKIESARERMTQSVIGLLVLVGTVAISSFIGARLGINLLRLEFENNINSAGSATGGSYQFSGTVPQKNP